jgi:hypothetical protein
MNPTPQLYRRHGLHARNFGAALVALVQSRFDITAVSQYAINAEVLRSPRRLAIRKFPGKRPGIAKVSEIIQSRLG